MATANYKLITDSTGLRIATALETLTNIGDPVTIGHGGTNATTAEQACINLNALPISSNAGFHNSIFRGKYLGTSVTSAQWGAIGAGTFEDLFIGDYWTINSINWRIAAFDYWWNCGDTACNTHHIVIVPDSNLLNANGSTTHWMNTTNTTEGAYIGSDFYTGNNSNTGKSQCITKFNNAFGSAHLLSHRELFANAVSNGVASGWAWYDSTVDMMNESMVYGSPVSGTQKTGDANFNVGIDKSQLPLFALAPSFICNRAHWWLRDVVSAAAFARVANHGDATSNSASANSVGVRPACGIKA